MKQTMLRLALLFCVLTPLGVLHAEEGPTLKKVNISLDQTTLRKGLNVFTDVCMGCHSLRYMTWRDLMRYPEIGLSRQDVDDLRGDAPLTARMLTELSAKDAMDSYGIVPPDLSLIARARKGHGAYIYSILTGFEHDPKGRVPDGNYNVYFPGHRIAMSDPLGWLDHDSEDEADLKAQAQDVASFLTFVGEPHQVERLAIGKWVMIFLVLMTFVLWLLKRAVWQDVEH